MTPTMRKRRMMPASEVANAILKSSPVPISTAEAQESINLLTTLCPFFLKAVNVAGEDWLELVSSRPAEGKDVLETPTKHTRPTSPSRAPSSPSRARAGEGDARESLTLSPRRVKSEGGGLREVRERIRRELENE
jgi:hypothetical protein